jgi:hypothetical protein
MWRRFPSWANLQPKTGHAEIQTAIEIYCIYGAGITAEHRHSAIVKERDLALTKIL